MTTAAEIIEDGLALILVDQVDIGQDPATFAIGVRFLNDWCADQFDSGVDFGYRPVANAGDPVTSPASVNLALKYIVGKLVAPAFGMPIPPEVMIEANKAEDRLVSRFLRITPSSLTRQTPIGSGNSGYIYGSSGDSAGASGSFYDSFYNSVAVPKAYLRLDESTTVTIATIDTNVAVTGPWVIDSDVNTTSTTAGVIKFNTRGAYMANLEANLTVDSQSGDQFTFYFTKNGAVLEQSRLPFDADQAQNLLVKWVGTLQDTDEIALVVQNNSDTGDLTITNGHLRVS